MHSADLLSSTSIGRRHFETHAASASDCVPSRIWACLNAVAVGKLTTHILDVANGTPAAGMRIELHSCESVRRLVTRVTANADGRCDEPLLQDAALRAGRYLLTFHVADYFRAQGVRLDDPPFLDEVVIQFGIADATQNYHVPLLVSPWSYSTYRGS